MRTASCDQEIDRLRSNLLVCPGCRSIEPGRIELRTLEADGEPVAYARRVTGRHYVAARVQTKAVANRTLVCGDALDPPLVPTSYDRVVAFNVLDSVRLPRQLLSVVDALCVPGGEIILSSP